MSMPCPSSRMQIHPSGPVTPSKEMVTRWASASCAFFTSSLMATTSSLISSSPMSLRRRARGWNAMLPFLAPTLTGSAPFEGAPETSCDRLDQHGRDRVAQLGPLIRWRTTENIAVVERLNAGCFTQADGSYLRRVNVAVTILRKVGDDRLAGTVAAEPGVLVIEHVAAVTHQIPATVPLEGMDAVLARPQHRVEL